MKRARSQTSSADMSPGIENEGFTDGDVVNGSFAPQLDLNGDVSHVTVVGAGPSGLMLAYVLFLTLIRGRSLTYNG